MLDVCRALGRTPLNSNIGGFGVEARLILWLKFEGKLKLLLNGMNRLNLAGTKASAKKVAQLIRKMMLKVIFQLLDSKSSIKEMMPRAMLFFFGLSP